MGGIAVGIDVVVEWRTFWGGIVAPMGCREGGRTEWSVLAESGGAGPDGQVEFGWERHVERRERG